MAPPVKVTDDQVIDALREHGSVRAAARALGVDYRAIWQRKERLALKGWSPEHDMTKTVPDGFKVRGVSTLYDRDGIQRAQWVKSSADDERREILIREAVAASVEGLPKLAPRRAKGVFLPSLMACYPIGDAHIGMLSWPEETGEAWDLAIAEQVQCGAMAALVEGAPAAERATIVNLGDWLHYDSMEPKTSRSGHVLDSDGRYAKMVRVAIKVMRQCIESALAKHRTVHVVNVIGNHDDTGALWLSAALGQMYEREPRVTVDPSPAAFNYFRHGRVLVGLHHGHSCKFDQLPGVMAADRAQDWGECLHRYWWTGHWHHKSLREYPGVTVETFGTLAAKDAWATAGGYRSARDMKCIVLHDQFGEVARHTVNPAMLEAA
jgi:hypothetical protein